MASLEQQVPYCRKYKESSGLKILKERLLMGGMNHGSGPKIGPFHLFLRRSFFQCVLNWTRHSMRRKGYRNRRLSVDELMAYFGIEIAMPLNRLNRIKDYWLSTMFLCNHWFS